eukprot:4727240-Prymnesium_polylepis.1
MRSHGMTCVTCVTNPIEAFPIEAFPHKAVSTREASTQTSPQDAAEGAGEAQTDVPASARPAQGGQGSGLLVALAIGEHTQRPGDALLRAARPVDALVTLRAGDLGDV